MEITESYYQYKIKTNIVLGDALFGELHSLAEKARRDVSEYIRLLIEQAISKQQIKFKYKIKEELTRTGERQHSIFVKNREIKKRKESLVETEKEHDFFKELKGQYILNKKTHCIVDRKFIWAIYADKPKHLKDIFDGTHNIYKLVGQKITA